MTSSSVDAEEIKRFSERASIWWDLEGPIRILHKQCPAIRLPLITEGLKKVGKALQGLKFLDVGCGAGIVSESIAMLKADVTAIDPSEALINVAKDHLKTHDGLKVDYVCDTIENYCIDNKEKYDVVGFFDVAEHVADLRSILKASVETLKPGGSIFITTWNRTFMGWFYGIFILQTLLGIVPRGAHKISMFVKPSEIEEILKDYGCKTVELKGTWYSMFKRDWFFIKYTGVFYAMHAVKN